MHSEKESDITVHSIKPSPPIENQIIYIDKEPDITIHNIKLIEVSAKSIHNPPQVNDMITIEFKIQNVSNRPITLNQDIGSFVAARNPSHENEDFGYSNQSKTIQPQDNIKTKAYKIVDMPGIWQFGPCYALNMLVVSGEEGNFCPSEWRRFPVQVVQ